MAREYLTAIDLTQNELQNAVFQNLAADPGSPVAGQFYFNTVTNEARYYDGTVWKSFPDLGPGGDVIGPVSSTDNAVTRWDGTGGDTIQNSGVIIDNSNNMSGLGNITLSGTVDGRDVSVDGAALDDHLDGGASKHDATEIDYERLAGSRKNIDAATTEIETAVSELDDAVGALVGSPSNYSPSNATIVSDHLSAIDTALGDALSTDFLDSDFRISDNVDNTKKVAFEVSAVSTSTTRTITMPDENVDLGLISTTNTTLTDHLDGGASKHDATEIDYERADGSKKNIDAASDDVELALTDLDDAIGALAGSPTNYTPGDATIVADHLAAIDVALGTAIITDFADDVFRISDNTDNTKKIAFEASGITTSTTRTISMPDANVDLGQIATNEADIITLQGTAHAQNTDSGTSQTSFHIDSGNSGPRIKNSAGELQVRNAADADYADLRVENLFVEGTQTIINSNTVEIGDNEIELNSDNVLNSTNSDGGIAVTLLASDDTTRVDAKITYNESAEYWQSTIYDEVADTTRTRQLVTKFSVTLDDTDPNVTRVFAGGVTTFTVTHNFNTEDILASTKRITTGAEVTPDFVAATVDTATFAANGNVSNGVFRVTIVG